MKSLSHSPSMFTWQTPGEPYLPLQHKPSIPQISVLTRKIQKSQFSISLLISYPLSEAFPFQLGMILTAVPQCTFTFAVFWQATGKERWISLLLCVREDHIGRKPNTTFSSLKLPPLLCQNPIFQVSSVHFPNACTLPLLCHCLYKADNNLLMTRLFPPVFFLEKCNLWLQPSRLLLHFSKTPLSVLGACQAQLYLLWHSQSPAWVICLPCAPTLQCGVLGSRAAAPQPLLPSPPCLLVVNSSFKEALGAVREPGHARSRECTWGPVCPPPPPGTAWEITRNWNFNNVTSPNDTSQTGKVHPQSPGIFVSPAGDAGVTLLTPEPECQCWA